MNERLHSGYSADSLRRRRHGEKKKQATGPGTTKAVAMEERVLKLRDENLSLKRTVREQELQLKKLQTKLIRTEAAARKAAAARNRWRTDV